MNAPFPDFAMDTARDMLRRDEGIRLKPYRDTRGKLTIGVGRNLDDDGITLAEADMLLDNDISAAMKQLSDMFPWWTSMTSTRQLVLLNMCFNLGIGGLAGFKQALSAMQAGDYVSAAKEMEASQWYFQTGARAARLVVMMLQGE